MHDTSDAVQGDVIDLQTSGFWLLRAFNVEAQKSTPKNISKCVKNRVLSGRFLEDHGFCYFHLAPEMVCRFTAGIFRTFVRLSDKERERVTATYTPWKFNEINTKSDKGMKKVTPVCNL